MMAADGGTNLDFYSLGWRTDKGNSLDIFLFVKAADVGTNSYFASESS